MFFDRTELMTDNVRGDVPPGVWS